MWDAVRGTLVGAAHGDDTIDVPRSHILRRLVLGESIVYVYAYADVY